LTHSPQITDTAIAKALSHPLRVAILASLNDREATTGQLARELGSSLSRTGYHVRRLESLGLVALARRRIKAGTVEHSYTAIAQAKVLASSDARGTD
jgi:DNA-binding transcriptional ArsR family regulator